jgi:hypothetical protein
VPIAPARAGGPLGSVRRSLDHGVWLPAHRARGTRGGTAGSSAAAVDSKARSAQADDPPGAIAVYALRSALRLVGVNVRNTALLVVCLVLVATGCVGLVADPNDAGVRDGAPLDGGRLDAARDAGPPPPGLTAFTDDVQPAIVAHCSPCHVGQRFAFASLERAGATFTPDETRRNYEAFLQMVSLDAPSESRLLQKGLGLTNGGISHAGGSVLAEGDGVYATLRAWIDAERADRCPDCGDASPVQYVAYVEQPRAFWALDADPQVMNFGDRTRSHIRVQPVDPGTLAPRGEAFDFLPDSFCGPDGHCDFQNLAVSHAGDRMVFECRLSLEGADFLHNVRWNLCIAEIGSDGHAVSPRFLLPAAQRHHGRVIARTDPFGLTHPDGWPVQGEYDVHYIVRRRGDHGPTFSPEDDRIYYSSRGPTPHDGLETYQTYHGFDVLDHILAVRPDGTDRRTIYQNEGGIAELPFFLHDGTLAFHTWNLERMDRHMYTRAEPDGVTELPILGGNVQGPNMWGRAVQLSNGIVVGITGRRRSSIENYTPFALDHTLGTGLEPELGGFRMLDAAQFEQIIDFPDGYCEADRAPDGPSCAMDHFYADPSFAPDGRALLAYTPEHVHVPMGYDMQKFYPRSGSTPEEVVASLDPYLPRQMGVALMDENGAVTPLLSPAPGTMMRFPVWIGRRAPEHVRPWTTDDAVTTVDLHIADVPLWMSFRDARGREHASDQDTLDRIVALRVLVKEAERTSCLSDALPYRFNVLGPLSDHPTFLGINNASGFTRLAVPESAGGDAWGDVPLESDRSVHVRVPARRLLLIQGIDANGSVVRQHARVFALPGGHDLDGSVTRAAYPSQCGTCHGSIDHADGFHGLTETATIPFVPLSFDTEARRQPIVDLTTITTGAPTTFLHRVRPLLDRACVSCHSGATPAGELSLSATYSPTGNYPAGRWATDPDASPPGYLTFLDPAERVPSYEYSVAWRWFFQREDLPYVTSTEFAPLVASPAPLADLAPWDPAYQNLFAPNGIDRLRYLGGFRNSNFGRSDREGGNSSDAWLVEILTGRDVDPALTFTGPDHTGYLTEAEVREVMSVIDVGFPYMAHCDDRIVPSGPHASEPWGDVAVTQFDDATR